MTLIVAKPLKNFRPVLDARHSGNVNAVDGLYGLPLEDGYGLDTVVEGRDVSQPGVGGLDAVQVQVDAREHCADQVEGHGEERGRLHAVED